MTKIIAKLGISILTVVTLLFSSFGILITTSSDIFPSTAHAALRDLEFDVTKYLKLPGKEPTDAPVQSQVYFEKNEDGSTLYPTIKFITDVIELMTKIAGTIAVIMLILSGFVMMFSQGNQNAVEKAKSMLMYTIIGTIVIFMSYMLVTLVQSIFTNV